MQRGVIQLTPPALQLLNEQARQLSPDFDLLKQKLASASAHLATPWGIQSPAAGTSFETASPTPSTPPDPVQSPTQQSPTSPTPAQTSSPPTSPPTTNTIGLEISEDDAEALLDTLPAPEPEEQARLTQARKTLQTFLLLLRQ